LLERETLDAEDVYRAAGFERRSPVAQARRVERRGAARQSRVT
jgi:hypothetical protein